MKDRLIKECISTDKHNLLKTNESNTFYYFKRLYYKTILYFNN